MVFKLVSRATGDTVPVFASGMCKDCYIHFVQATGGMSSRGADPPAYTRGRQKADALVSDSDLNGLATQLQTDRSLQLRLARSEVAIIESYNLKALEGPEEEERPALPAYAREGAEELALDFAAELDQKNGEVSDFVHSYSTKRREPETIDRLLADRIWKHVPTSETEENLAPCRKLQPCNCTGRDLQERAQEGSGKQLMLHQVS